MDASGCLSWPTVRTGGGNRNSRQAIINESGHPSGASGLGLEQAVDVFQGRLPKELHSAEELPQNWRALWPTATVMDGHGARNATSGRSNPNSRHHGGTTLNDAIRIWETPTVAMVNGTRRNRGGDRQGELLLTGQAADLSHRCSHPDLQAEIGEQSSLHGRTLNPLFVEWLMGWPIGWTGSGPVETASSPWWQAMRGELLRLVSRRPADGQGSLL